jgi:hypothetical protein
VDAAPIFAYGTATDRIGQLMLPASDKLCFQSQAIDKAEPAIMSMFGARASICALTSSESKTPDRALRVARWRLVL